MRGCADAVFTARRVLEEVRDTCPRAAWSKCDPVPGDDPDPATDDGVYALFIDLKKAFDSVPRELLWEVLRAHGVPEGVIMLVRDMHAAHV